MALLGFATGGIIAIVATIWSAIQIKLAKRKRKKMSYAPRCVAQMPNPPQDLVKALAVAAGSDTNHIRVLYRGSEPGMENRFSCYVYEANGNVAMRTFSRGEIGRALAREANAKGVSIGDLLK